MQRFSPLYDDYNVVQERAEVLFNLTSVSLQESPGRGWKQRPVTLKTQAPELNLEFFPSLRPVAVARIKRLIYLAISQLCIIVTAGVTRVKLNKTSDCRDYSSRFETQPCSAKATAPNLPYTHCPWINTPLWIIRYYLLPNSLALKIYNRHNPVGWGCRIQRLHFCRGVRCSPQRVSWIWH